MRRIRTRYGLALLAAAVVAVGAGGAAAGYATTTTGSPYLSYGSKPGQLNLKLTAGELKADGGLNFNGFSHGRMIVRVPLGSTVNATFANASKEMPHSVVITDGAKSDIVRIGGFKPAFAGAETPNPTKGIRSGTQHFTFRASRVGRYGIVCAIPGHALGGMWDYLQVVPKSQAPSITLGAKTITLKKP